MTSDLGPVTADGVPVSELVDALTIELHDARVPADAAPMAKYMKDNFPFLGVKTPARRTAMRRVFPRGCIGTDIELDAIVRDLYAFPEREYHQCAVDLFIRYRKVVGESLDLVTFALTTHAWWDSVDALAGHVVGPITLDHPSTIPEVDSWIDSDDLWLARTAIISQLRSKDRTDADRLFAHCLRRAGDSEFFLRKAIGWALREYAKTDPDAVRAFVADHDDVLSTLSKREAMKHL